MCHTNVVSHKITLVAADLFGFWQSEARKTIELLTALPIEVPVQIMIQSAAHA